MHAGHEKQKTIRTEPDIGVSPEGLGVETPDFGVGSWGLNEILLYPINAQEYEMKTISKVVNFQCL